MRLTLTDIHGSTVSFAGADSIRARVASPAKIALMRPVYGNLTGTVKLPSAAHAAEPIGTG